MTTEMDDTQDVEGPEANLEIDNNVEELMSDKDENEDEVQVSEEPKEPDFKEKFLYIAAEMENFKRRVEREKALMVKFGNENILRDLVDVVDNFERTVAAIKMDEDEKMKNVVVGIEMIGKQFIDTLAKYGLKEVKALGESFDPNFHEAIAQDNQSGAKPMEILMVHQKGYTLNERLIRPARVVVQEENK